MQGIASIPFSAQGYGTMWFMYTLVGLYLLTPILATWLQRASRSAVEFYLIAWVISLCYPFIGKYLEINTSNTGILYYFSGYAGYYVLGWYLKHNPRRLSIRLLTALSLGFIILKGADKVFELGFDSRDAFWYLSITVATMCAAWWMICTCFAKTTLCKNNNIFIKALRLVSDYSFGIYLCHILIMRFWLWKSPWIQSIAYYSVQTFVVALATFAFSLILCIALSKLPMGQYIVGYKKR